MNVEFNYKFFEKELTSGAYCEDSDVATAGHYC